jgi:hypothetical protein
MQDMQNYGLYDEGDNYPQSYIQDANFDQPTQQIPSGYTPSFAHTYLPNETRWQRFMRGVGNFLAAVIRKVDQLLGFALGLLMLLLTIHFLLVLFQLTNSLFSQWVSVLSTPLLRPFEHFLPIFRYQSFIVDASTVAAMVAYILLVALIRWFLRVLFSRP